jgi:hypothetical protein
MSVFPVFRVVSSSLAVISQSGDGHMELVFLAALAVQQEHGLAFDGEIRARLYGSIHNARANH